MLNKFKRAGMLVGEVLLVLVCCYIIAVLFTLMGVAMGGVAVDDTSVWSNHIRNVAVAIIN